MDNVGDRIRHLLDFIEGGGDVTQSVGSQRRELGADMDKLAAVAVLEHDT